MRTEESIHEDYDHELSNEQPSIRNVQKMHLLFKEEDDATMRRSRVAGYCVSLCGVMFLAVVTFLKPVAVFILLLAGCVAGVVWSVMRYVVASERQNIHTCGSRPECNNAEGCDECTGRWEAL